jgi:predicted AAA+ superfamily ATPase
MNPLLPRKELADLGRWFTHTERKPLVIRGARQVGKSTLVRQFAQMQGLDLLELNFERNPEYKAVFNSRDPVQILNAIYLLTGKKVDQTNGLLFLDEIQAAPEAFAALRYFHEEMPHLPVIAAGSLLEFALAELNYAMPVGRIEYFHLGAMQFDDFLLALGHPELVEYLQNISLQAIQQQNMLDPVHQRLLALMKQYWVVGGLPEALAQYARTQDYGAVMQVQRSIVSTYRDDFNKYSYGKLNQQVQKVFDHLPGMVGHKFKYSQVSREDRAAELGKALEHLCMARVAHKIQHSSANGAPLAAEMNPRYFKALYFDIGLLCAALNLNLLDLDKGDASLINNGALAEQFIGQHLLYANDYYHQPELYYWMREKKSAAAEIDYLWMSGQHIVPVEIKAGKTGTLKSLHQFLKEKNRQFALRFNADRPSLLADSKQMTDGSIIKYELLSLPLYMVTESPRLIRQYLA